MIVLLAWSVAIGFVGIWRMYNNLLAKINDLEQRIAELEPGVY
jgi:hypothetical protein